MKSSVPLPQYIPILTAVWFKRGKDDWVPAKISTRRGGVYQIEILGGETRLVQRWQIKKMQVNAGVIPCT